MFKDSKKEVVSPCEAGSCRRLCEVRCTEAEGAQRPANQEKIACKWKKSTCKLIKHLLQFNNTSLQKVPTHANTETSCKLRNTTMKEVISLAVGQHFEKLLKSATCQWWCNNLHRLFCICMCCDVLQCIRRWIHFLFACALSSLGHSRDVIWECNVFCFGALGCSGLGAGVVIKIDVFHHYYVPQRKQEHSIHHPLKLGMYFSQLTPSPFKTLEASVRIRRLSLSRTFIQNPLKFFLFLIDCVHSFCSCTFSYNRQTVAGSVIDLSEIWFSP